MATTAPDDGPGLGSVPAFATERYQLKQRIARGGMGEVYTALDRNLNRVVAIKILRADLRDRPQIVARFLEEARITGQFQHPGIPPIHDLGALPDGMPFIAMKLIKGRTLADALANDPADRAALLPVLEQIAQTVAYAHSKGVIHRDLKPGNVMVGAFGEVQVMDWGLAKSLFDKSEPRPEAAPAVSKIESDRESGAQTQAGTLLGTVAYMPPEQARGEIEHVDARADVFALGAILCEILTGAPPYVGSEAMVRGLALTGDLRPAFDRLANCGADAELVALARRCLSAEQAGRPADAEEVARAITSYRAGVADRLRHAEVERAEAAVRATEVRKRRRVQWVLAACGVILLISIGASLWWADRQEQKRAETERQRLARNAQAVETSLVQCEEGLRAFNPDLAALAMAQIGKQLGDGGAEGLRPRIDSCRTDLDMLRDLERADDALWTAEDRSLRAQRSSEAFTKAFARYGVTLGEALTDDRVRRVTESRIRDRLVQALDLWSINHPTTPPRPRALRKLLAAADPDPFRNEVRDAILRPDRAWSQALLDDPRADQQPAWFAAVWAQASNFSAAGRERILRKALDRSPGDSTLLHTMIMICESTDYRPETSAQQLRWAQAAVSVRPKSKVAWRSLGRANWEAGQMDAAVSCYKKACRLDPNDFNSWTQLSAALLRAHDPEAALEAVKKALALNSYHSSAQNYLGLVLERMGRHEEARKGFERAIEIDARNAASTSGTFNNLGQTLLRMDDLDGAIRCFEEALRLSPSFGLAETNLTVARTLKREGKPPEEAPPPRERQER